MIGCDNDLCPIEWFHFNCVQLSGIIIIFPSSVSLSLSVSRSLSIYLSIFLSLTLSLFLALKLSFFLLLDWFLVDSFLNIQRHLIVVELKRKEFLKASLAQFSGKPKGKWFCPKCRGDKPTVMKPKAQFLKELERFNKEKEDKLK